jgi:hypothetical protein
LGYVDRVAALGFSQLHLYTEHTFAFAFDPEIWRGCSPLMAEDIRRIDERSRNAGIDLVPSLACFGHMGRVLSLPPYRDFCEISSEIPWEDQPWPARMRGLTLDTRNPEARRLVESMLDEYLPMFSSSFANVGCDETHDLGMGRNRAFADRHGRGRLYVDHLNFLAEVCRRHGKRMMFWGDVIRNHPEFADDVPKDAAILDWGYEADSSFPALTSPARGGREVIACPGTSAWNRIIPGFNNAFANIARAFDAARSHDAIGVIVTDWGDHGHFNAPTCSLPAIAFAAYAANNSGPLDFPKALRYSEDCTFGNVVEGRFDAILRLAAPGDRHQTWPALYSRLDEAFPFTWTLAKAQSHAGDAAFVLSTLEQCRDSIVADEWRIACLGSILFAQKFAIQASQAVVAAAEVATFKQHVDAFAEVYATVWRRHYREDRLGDILAVINAMGDSKPKQLTA